MPWHLRYVLHFLEVVSKQPLEEITWRDCNNLKSGPEKGVITKAVFSLEKSLESLENGRNHFSFPQSGGSLETLESLNSLESLENLGLF